MSKYWIIVAMLIVIALSPVPIYLVSGSEDAAGTTLMLVVMFAFFPMIMIITGDDK